MHDVHGLLAGSRSAQEALVHDAPTLARRLHTVTTDTFVTGLRVTVIIISALVCAIGVAAALAARRSRPVTDGYRGSPPVAHYSGSPPVAAAVDPES